MPYHFECDGIGTHWWFEILDDTYPPDMKEQVVNLITCFDEDYSRFKPTSYVGQLNADKVLYNPPAELVAMFRYARTMYDVSGGVFDMSVGGALHRQGYGSRELAASIHKNMWHDTVVTSKKIQIPANVVLDNGGFGKGWLIDGIGQLLKGQGITQFVINGGGDILVASDTPITFGLEDPRVTGRLIGSVDITHGALAGSSNIKRSWQHEGKTYHHIIDPRQTTDAHRRHMLGTFVQARTALIADSMATILLLRPELNNELTKRFHLQTMLIPDKTKTQTSL